MKTSLKSRYFVALATAALPCVAQTATPAPPEEAGMFVDTAWHPVPPGAMSPGVRIAPDAFFDFVRLPDTLPRSPDAGLTEAGYVEDLAPELIPPPDWSPTVDGGRTWAIEFTSAQAQALRVRFRGRFGFDGLELRVYDPVSGATFGPYDAFQPDDNGHSWSTIIFGESIGLEFHVPAGVEVSPHMPEIDGIAYHNVPPPDAEPMQLGCGLEDVSCYPGWLDVAEGVCMLAVVNGNMVPGYCSGGLLNRNPSDGSPLIMTANHCDPFSRATVFVWNFRTSRCGDPDNRNGNGFDRNDGAYLMRSDSTADWKLLALREPPKTDTYLGWDAGFWDSFADGTGVHHPSGRLQKYSSGYNEGAAYAEFCGNGPCFWAHVWCVRLTTGTTLPGSSGSPIFDSSKRVRGTLSGGPNCDVSCYGRLAHAWDRMQPFLSNPASPVYVDAGYGGEDMYGTSENPFPRLVQGAFAVRARDRVILRAGSYAENLRLFRPMTLTASGGVVRIGN